MGLCSSAPKIVDFSSMIVVRVPEDCPTILEALEKAEAYPAIQTIEVGKGEWGNPRDPYGQLINDPKSQIRINCPITIIGKGNKIEVVVVEGFRIKKGLQGNVHVQNLTIRPHQYNIRSGVYAESPFTMEDVTVEECGADGYKGDIGGHGVCAVGTACVARCTNVEVRYCKFSGVIARGGSIITLVGAKTTVHHNSSGKSGVFGLEVNGPPSKIQLVHPLTKESVATNNPGGGNFGATCGADIKQIEPFYASPEDKQQGEKEAAERAATAAAELVARIKTTGEIRVPEDFPTITAALETAKKDPLIRKILVGKGEHALSDSVAIDFSIAIVGNGDKTEVVVVGGFNIPEDVQGNIHVQNLTIRNLEGTGVQGQSTFTLEDVIVEQCGHIGVHAYGTACVARCTNVEVRQCRESGALANEGASMILVGAKTTVHHNNTNGNSGFFGLQVDGANSTLQLVHPLTKESVSTDNTLGEHPTLRYPDGSKRTWRRVASCNWGAGGGTCDHCVDCTDKESWNFGQQCGTTAAIRSIETIELLTSIEEYEAALKKAKAAALTAELTPLLKYVKYVDDC